MIDIKNIKKSFGSLQVLKGIDLHIDKGEVVSIASGYRFDTDQLRRCDAPQSETVVRLP